MCNSTNRLCNACGLKWAKKNRTEKPTPDSPPSINTLNSINQMNAINMNAHSHSQFPLNEDSKDNIQRPQLPSLPVLGHLQQEIKRQIQ